MIRRLAIAVSRSRRGISALAAGIVLALAAVGPARAQDGPTIIRDDEIAGILDSYARPILQAAGMAPERVEIVLVRDSGLNAFVAGGRRLYLNTGLLRSAQNAAEVLGVIAHETAHMAGGDLVGLAQAQDRARTQAVASTLLGIATAIATGRGDAGAAVAIMGQDAAATGLASYSRSEERAADSAAVTYLEKAGLPTHGLVSFMERLADKAAGQAARQPAYLRTHPMPQDRVAFLKSAIADRGAGGATLPDSLQRSHARLLAKLNGFLETPARTLELYAGRDDRPARYARAIATYRQGDSAKALQIVASLIADRPQDPYFHALAGQIRFETGQNAAAVESYRRAVELADQPIQIRVGLARAAIALGGEERLREARNQLRAALELDNDLPFAWRQLAIAEGRLDKRGLSALALAEAAYLKGNDRTARRQARRALELLPADSSGRRRARDILQTGG